MPVSELYDDELATMVRLQLDALWPRRLPDLAKALQRFLAANTSDDVTAAMKALPERATLPAMRSERPTTRPRASMIGETVSETSSNVPSLRRRIVS